MCKEWEMMNEAAEAQGEGFKRIHMKEQMFSGSKCIFKE